MRETRWQDTLKQVSACGLQLLSFLSRNFWPAILAWVTISWLAWLHNMRSTLLFGLLTATANAWWLSRKLSGPQSQQQWHLLAIVLSFVSIVGWTMLPAETPIAIPYKLSSSSIGQSHSSQEALPLKATQQTGQNGTLSQLSAEPTTVHEPLVHQLQFPTFPSNHQVGLLLSVALDRDRSIHGSRTGAIQKLLELRNSHKEIQPWLEWIVADDRDDDYDFRSFCQTELKTIRSDIGKSEKGAQDQPFQPGEEEKLERIIQQLSDLNPDRRLQALYELKLPAMRAPAAVAKVSVPKLIQLLSDKTHLVRLESVDCLERMGKSASPAIPQLIEIAAMKKDTVHARAMWERTMAALPLIGDGPAFVRFLNAPAPQVRLAAARAIAESKDLPAATGTINSLAKLLSISDNHTRRLILRVFGRFGPDARDAVPDLIDLCKSKGGDHDIWKCFGDIGPDASAAVPILIEAIRKNKPGHLAAIEAIGKFGSKGAPAVPVLVEYLEETHQRHQPTTGWIPQVPMGETRRPIDAMEALASIGESAGAAAPFLRQFLGNPDEVAPDTTNRNKPEYMPECAVRTLAALGQSGVAELLSALKVANPRVSRWAAVGLGKYSRDESVVLAAIRLLDDPSPEVRLAASHILLYRSWYQRPVVYRHVTVLIRISEDSDYQIRVNAIRTLDVLGPDTCGAIPTVLRAATDENSADVREAARRALKPRRALK